MSKIEVLFLVECELVATKIQSLLHVVMISDINAMRDLNIQFLLLTEKNISRYSYVDMVYLV